MDDQALLQPEEEEFESQNERQAIRVVIGQGMLNLKQSKSLEILKSALKIFTSNTKFMLLMILSILPFFTFMIFYEIKLHKAIYALTDSLLPPSNIIYLASIDSPGHYQYPDYNSERKELFPDIIQLALFYLVIYPLLEIFTIITVIKLAEKTVKNGEEQANLKEVIIYQKNNFKGSFTTYLYIHLLSALTLMALFWTLSNHFIFTGGSKWKFYDIWSIDFFVKIVSILVHSVIFLTLLYKYLEWSGFWNMAMVISVLEEETTGIEALEMSSYYGKHCKKTGFGLMLVFCLWCCSEIALYFFWGL